MSITNSHALAGRARGLIDLAKKITDKAVAEGRELTDEETYVLDGIKEEVDGLQNQIEQIDNSDTDGGLPNAGSMFH